MYVFFAACKAAPRDKIASSNNVIRAHFVICHFIIEVWLLRGSLTTMRDKEPHKAVIRMTK